MKISEPHVGTSKVSFLNLDSRIRSIYGVLTASVEGLNIATVIDMESNRLTSEEDG